HIGTAVDESADGRNGTDGDGAEIAHPVRGRSHEPALLVRDVDGAACRLHLRLSDELVASGLPSQARNDDGAAGGCRCRRARRRGSGDAAPHATMSMGRGEPPWPPIPVMTLLSFLALGAGVAIAFLLRAT